MQVPDLKCLVRLEPPNVRAIADGVARCRAHRASFAHDAADAEATGGGGGDTDSEYSDADGSAEEALRLMVRTSPATLAAATAAAAATVDEPPPPPRAVLRYQLPAAAVPPPLLAVMQVNDAASRRADAVGVPRWHVFIRVQVRRCLCRAVVVSCPARACSSANLVTRSFRWC